MVELKMRTDMTLVKLNIEIEEMQAIKSRDKADEWADGYLGGLLFAKKLIENPDMQLNPTIASKLGMIR